MKNATSLLQVYLEKGVVKPFNFTCMKKKEDSSRDELLKLLEEMFHTFILTDSFSTMTTNGKREVVNWYEEIKSFFTKQPPSSHG